ncbi:nucleoside diphosphate kinase [Actinidia rufa]|uniref:nucleoside-diphosphate kinase n=1 Tax=Actinidia rufa TaxID=165716 RepID=A0A7J0DHU1_9ERIC|nr:nucleoside diphosphate kinase [Actinidia rufa]
MEQTFIMIKPDGVQRGLVGEIVGRFEKKGFYLKGLKLMTVERPFAEKHYADLSSKPFFHGLVDYIISGPVVAMVGRVNYHFPILNVIHGSDSWRESARKEIALWFPEGIAEWQSSVHPWIYE